MIEKIKKKFKKRNITVLNSGKYQEASVLLPILEFKKRTYILFQKRSKYVRQAGEICFPGGFYDGKKDFSFKETSIRETCEELGINKKNIEIIGNLGSLITPLGMHINIYVGRININRIEEFCINEKEVEKVFMIPLSFFIKNNPKKYFIKIYASSKYRNENGETIKSLPAKELGLPSRYHDTWEGNNYPVFYYKTNYGAIWGITAEIIHEFVNLI